MKCMEGHAPFWKHSDRTRAIKLDLLIGCIPLLIPQIVRFGMRPLFLVLASGLFAVLTEIFCCLILHREIKVYDLDSLSVGVLIGMLMPANIAFLVPATAVFFAVAVAKMPFGGTARAPFHPVAAGMAFGTLCFPNQIFKYADVLSGKMDWNIFRAAEVIAAQSPTALLNTGARPELLKPELMSGNVVGPIGTTVTFLTATVALYLFCRRSAGIRVSAGWMIAAAIYAWLFPRVSTGAWDSIMIELSTGSLVFFAAMIAPDSTIAPKLPIAQYLYGFLGGLLTMLYRTHGVFEQNAWFALLLVNAISHILDRDVWKIMQWTRRHRYEKAENRAE